MQVTEGQLFEWLGRLYCENRAVIVERDRLLEEVRLLKLGFLDTAPEAPVTESTSAVIAPKRKGEG